MNGGSQQTTTTDSAPWKPAQPALKLGLDYATKAFKADPTGKNSVYTGSTVVPWSQQTTQGMNLVQGNASANMGGQGVSGQYQDIINRGGYTGQQQQSANAMSDVVGGSGLTADQTGAMRGFQSLANDPFNAYQKTALQNTQNTANSAFDINSNPAFMDVLKQAQNSARDAVNMSAGGAGRYGGGVHQGNLASEVGDLTARMVGSEYNNWQNRRDAANSNLFNMGQTGIGTQMGAQGNVANLGQTGTANRMTAAQNLYNMGQGAIGNLGTAYQGLNAPAQDLFQIGAMNEDLSTRKLNDKLRIFNEKQNAPWSQAGRLNAIASGAGQMGGTQTQAQPGQNPFLTALGYGTTVLGGLGGLL
ncbi:MAG: hypothetical protein QMD99_13825 [Rhizobiaceae bacterium]|nr:hypothetical protein [Rhizobiaceae bacterium]